MVSQRGGFPTARRTLQIGVTKCLAVPPQPRSISRTISPSLGTSPLALEYRRGSIRRRDQFSDSMERERQRQLRTTLHNSSGPQPREGTIESPKGVESRGHPSSQGNAMRHVLLLTVTLLASACASISAPTLQPFEDG